MIPNEPTSIYRIGLAMLGQNRNLEAAAQFEKAAKLMPSVAEVHHFWGVALQRIGKARQASACFRTAIALNPGAVLSLVELAHLMHSVGDPEAAVECLQKVVVLQPESAKGHFMLARALAEMHRYDEAGASLVKAIELDPNLTQAYVLRGRLLQQQGRFNEGEQSLRHAISLNPDCADGYYSLVNGKRVTETDRSLVTHIEKLATSSRLSPQDQRPLRYALGKAYEDLGEYERAIDHFHEANRLSQERLVALGRVFDPVRLRRQIDGVIARYRDSVPKDGSESERPVFIVGMARSGTTLLEQIVSSHPKVAAAGELGTWKEIEQIQRSGAATRTRLLEVATHFLARLDQFSTSAERITVKTPQNALILGDILSVFPHCRILHCRRSPIDTGLSIYTTNFFSGPDFAHDRASLVIAYKEYLRVMAHWREILPKERFLEVSYEELVTNPEPLLKRVVDFLGLEWDDSLLHHEKNEHPISTPSLWQARQPVFTKSIERWRRYEPWLGPLTELLEV